MQRDIAEIVRVEGGRVVATLTRLTGSIERAEDAFAEAVVVALERWPVDGVPLRPGAWLTTVARRKALDALRRESNRSAKEEAAMRAMDEEPVELPSSAIRDDQLRLIFTCCHPALSPESRVALCLRLVCGLTTAEIASVAMVPEATIGQRISRAKAKIARAHIAYQVPADHELPARVGDALAVVYSVFTIGHHAPRGAAIGRVDLADEAIRLARLLSGLMPDEPECIGLLALLLATHARSSTRLDPSGEVVLLADADRSRWDREATQEAIGLLEMSLRRKPVGPYQLQAAISCLHSIAPDVEHTDWPQIVQLYDLLVSVQPTLGAQLNRAIAVGEASGPSAGLAALDALAGSERAQRWHLFHAARGEMLCRLGRRDDARDALRLAVGCESNDTERRLLERRLADLGG